MNEDDFTLFTKLIKDKSGIALTAAKLYLLESRLQPVALRHHCKDLTDLAALLRGHASAALIYEVVEAMTTNETLFFRDDKPFRHFRAVLLPAMLQERAQKKTLRIWSAACSTGQEPYSIAIILSELLQDQPNWHIDILATDISVAVLEQARRGVYSQFEIQRGLPAALIIKYFTRQDTQWQIADRFRRMVKFEEFNLLHGMERFGAFDIIFCRNVLIYFDEPTKKTVLQNLSRRLAPDGLLFLGGTESAHIAAEHLALSEGCPGLYKLSKSKAGVMRA